MKATSIVTIKEKKPLFKGSEEAHSIELISFEENGFEIVTQKNLYEVGDKVVYIQPDYCLSDIDLFKSFIESGKLGSNNRIKAIKFNFNTEPNNTAKTYSVGILLPLNEVYTFITEKADDTYPSFNILDAEVDLDEMLGITKYEEPEKNQGGVKSGLVKARHLPEGMYKTDEINIKNVIKDITYPIELIGTLKVDGSSCTIYYRDEEHYGICSRNQEKKLDQKQIIGYEGFKRWYIPANKEVGYNGEKGWLREEDNLFYNDRELEGCYEREGITPIWDELYDDFINLGKPILDKLVEYCKANNKSLALRGEIAGKNLKGSGNKHNPHSKLEPAFYLFGVDDYSTGVTKPLSYEEMQEIFNTLNLSWKADFLFKETFNSFEEIKAKCKFVFQDKFDKFQLIEGIVLRTPDSKFSCKFMNDEYDEKK